MKQFDRTNSGILGRNKNRKNDKQPGYKGTINIGGVEYWLSGWVKIAGDNAPNPGSKFFSLSVTPKDGFPDRKPPPKGELTEANWATKPLDDSEIPF